MPLRPRVLFVAEAVTLAHVARSSVLARLLDPEKYDVHVAWDPRYEAAIGQMPCPVHHIVSIPTETFLARLSRGRPMHDAATLRAYVQEDLGLIRGVSPDIIVGDFRLSLAASTRLANVPLVSLANAYWSPWGRQTFLFPEYDYPLSNVVGRLAARQLFRLFRSAGFAAHTRPLNGVLRSYGLPSIGSDLRTMYTFGDATAYCDIPELVRLPALPPSQRCIGAVLWSPRVRRPDWWNDVPQDRPIVYVTPGSSGELNWLPLVLDALSDLPLTVVAATAGRLKVSTVPQNAHIADFLPGTEAASRASLVISNGGSPTTAQALAAGVPVLGVVSNNMDQHLNMEAVCTAGAGEVLPARGVTAAQLREAVTRLLTSIPHQLAARELARAHQACNPRERFPALLEAALSSRT